MAKKENHRIINTCMQKKRLAAMDVFLGSYLNAR
ncbi:hypothetical protein DJICPGNB_25605 [Escherichia coli]|nr:hypothetical protein DJICPGNB_25605 [Escherichia coli]